MSDRSVLLSLYSQAKAGAKIRETTRSGKPYWRWPKRTALADIMAMHDLSELFREAHEVDAAAGCVVRRHPSG
jgi:hypothetical protein